MSQLRRPLPALVLAWSVFAVAALVPWFLRQAGFGGVLDSQRWLPHALIKTALALLAIGLATGGGSPRQSLGLVPAMHPRWWLCIWRGALLGAITSVLIAVTPAEGMPWLLRDLGFGGMVLWIWLYSSVTEELFVRGWLQPFLAIGDAPIPAFGRLALSPRVLCSGLFFGSLHLTLLLRDTDPWTVVIIVAATTVLGVFAALDRERSRSLGPPIATHVAFNVGGFLGGAIAALATLAITGQLPQH